MKSRLSLPCRAGAALVCGAAAFAAVAQNAGVNVPNLAPGAATGAAAANAPPAAPNPVPAATPAAARLEALREQVFAAERAFARSMAERDHAAFVHHLSEQALFFNGRQVLRGKAAVAAGWRPLYELREAPFSWEPDQVEVLADGTLALSTGPVRDASGQVIARFNSIWRQEAPGTWRVIFDKGSPAEAGLR
jgi:ketosteroid isomerase-like protein